MPDLYPGSITDIPGIEVGHAADAQALTGCTVILCRNGAVAGVDVRGLAPGTRETDLLRPGSLVERVHAILLAGGSAFGLAAADGVMRFLEERNIGFDAGVARVPIVPAAVVFDLGIGDARRRPDAEMGYAACATASRAAPPQGSVGAAMGATVGKIMGVAQSCRGGFGTASVRSGRLRVAAAVVVNAFGDVWDRASSTIVAGARGPGGFLDTESLLAAKPDRSGVPLFGNTVVGVVATNASLGAAEVTAMASAGHDGLARAVRPAHTLVDGDTLFGLSSGSLHASRLVVCALAATAVERAIVNAVWAATGSAGVPAARDLLT
jgi:L-aminopeptidase/D-esterase-like protein